MIPEQERLVDVIYSQRGVRRFKPDPVDPDLIRQVIEAATFAPSSTNSQLWRFLVVTDPELRAGIGRIYGESFFKDRQGGPLSVLTADPVLGHTYREAAYLAEHMGEVPVHILIAHQFTDRAGASIYPACQNLMLRAWSLGLGTVLTTVWLRRAAEMRALLRVPDDYQLEAIIALGWPARPYGPPKRRPAAEVTYWNEWGVGRVAN